MKSNLAVFFVAIVCMLSFRGGGKLSRPVYLDPIPPMYQSKIILLFTLILNYSEYEDVSVINIIQVIFSCFLCRIISNATLRGGEQAVQAS